MTNLLCHEDALCAGEKDDPSISRYCRRFIQSVIHSNDLNTLSFTSLQFDLFIVTFNIAPALIQTLVTFHSLLKVFCFIMNTLQEDNYSATRTSTMISTL